MSSGETPPITRRWQDGTKTTPHRDRIPSPRAREVMVLVLAGYSRHEIARGISLGTVRTYRQQLRRSGWLTKFPIWRISSSSLPWTKAGVGNETRIGAYRLGRSPIGTEPGVRGIGSDRRGSGSCSLHTWTM